MIVWDMDSMRWAGHVAHMERKSVYRVLGGGEPDGMRPVGRPRRRRGNNIKMDLQKNRMGAWAGLIWLRIAIICRLL
jgi:hypothetical protein